MNTALAGGTLCRGEFRVPRLATLDLAGVTVREVVPRGKHLMIRFADGRTLHTHFRMDGSWHIYRPGTTWRGGPAFAVRAVLTTGDWGGVGYRLHGMAPGGTAARAPLAGRRRPGVLGPGRDPREA